MKSETFKRSELDKLFLPTPKAVSVSKLKKQTKTNPLDKLSTGKLCVALMGRLGKVVSKYQLEILGFGVGFVIGILV